MRIHPEGEVGQRTLTGSSLGFARSKPRRRRSPLTKSWKPPWSPLGVGGQFEFVVGRGDAAEPSHGGPFPLPGPMSFFRHTALENRTCREREPRLSSCGPSHRRRSTTGVLVLGTG